MCRHTVTYCINNEEIFQLYTVDTEHGLVEGPNASRVEFGGESHMLRAHDLVFMFH